MPRIRILLHERMRQPSSEVVQVSHREDGVTHSPDQQGRDVCECVESPSDSLENRRGRVVGSGRNIRHKIIDRVSVLSCGIRSSERTRSLGIDSGDSGCRPNKALCPAGHHSTDAR